MSNTQQHGKLYLTDYVFSDLHKYIGAVNATFNENIGAQGRNLTIAVLSFNRSSMTNRLMKSIQTVIPEFQGEFLIVDNGSEETEITALSEAMSLMPFRCRMIRLDRNYGPGGGRNRAMDHITTDWVMLLDNDIYFCANPLLQIQEDLATLGCHFLNMPLLDESGKKLFAYGGHIFVDYLNGKVYAGGSSVYSQNPSGAGSKVKRILSTFVFGGASVVNRQTFLECGGFDEGMLIGFEDTDFSLTLFRKGYKIGNCGIVALIHDHHKPEKKSDIEYEKVRFSRDILKKSAEYFETKNGICAWGASTEEWLKRRLLQMGIVEKA